MPVLHVSGMNTENGTMPMVDSYNRIVNIGDTLNIVAKTTAYTCLPEDSGKVFTTTGATGAVTFTLPAISAANAGWHAYFVNTVDQDMTVAGGTADKMVSDGDAAADSIAFSTSSHKIGGWCHIAMDGANYLILGAGFLQAVATAAT